MSILILALYIDFSRFHILEINYYKISPSQLDYNSELKGFSNFQNELGNEIVFHNHRAEIKIKNDKKYVLDLNANNSKYFNFLNYSSEASIKLSFYSLSYLTNYLLNHNNLNQNDIEAINSYYNLISEKWNKFLVFDEAIYNDHVISNRLYFNLIWINYLNKINSGLYSDIVEKLKTDNSVIFQLMKNHRNFTWDSNHGLIQIDALALLALNLENSNTQKYIFDLVAKRSLNMLNYLSGADGAIYEGASSYWIFIYEMFSNIEKKLPNTYLKEKNIIKQRMNKMRFFISHISTPTGRVQGFGDGYSQSLNLLNFDTLKNNRIYRFSNEFCGTQVLINKNVYSIQFISLDVKPNTHKLPEDLGIYISKNDTPIFMNMGNFNYDSRNPYRKQIVSDEKVHGCPSFQNSYKLPNKSHLNNPIIQKDKILFCGYKIYGNDTLFRMINFDYVLGKINIYDSSNSRKIIETRFLLNNKLPNVTFNCNNIQEAYYSDLPYHMNKCSALILKSNVNNLEIDLKESNSKKNIDFNIFLSNFQSQRNQNYKKLKEIYGKKLYIIRFNLLALIVLVFFVFNITSLYLLKKCR